MAQTKLNIGDLAPDFNLIQSDGSQFHLSEACKQRPVVLVFYPGDFTPVCTAQLCEYQDNFDEFKKWDVQLLGLSKDSSEKHQKFSKKYQFSFPLVTDSGNQVAKSYGCSSQWMLGLVSRAICVVGREQKLLYRHVESLPVTRRTSQDIIKALEELKTQKLI
ncbi:MAG: peroxiredoxin [Deltaproteobacteria bacterium]|nr:peroxiredoxin [Deltaproteobacteria bacterium]